MIGKRREKQKSRTKLGKKENKKKKEKKDTSERFLHISEENLEKESLKQRKIKQ